MFAITSAIFLALASSALADPSPLTPSTANTGSPCLISWTPDTSGLWNETVIELMTGPNQDMMHVTTVTTVDTTSAAPSTFTWTCPDVTLNAAVYWYQFSHAAQPTNLLWSTRFAIASSTGQVTAAPNQIQPDSGAEAIPWGDGNLVDPSTAKPAPSYITGETTAGAGNSTATVTAAIPSSSANVTSILTSAVPATPVGPASSLTTVFVTSTSSSASASSSAPAKTTNAGFVRAQGSIYALGAMAGVAGLMALL